MTYYIKENYYFDIDQYNQLRITGPQNHLLMGLTFPPDVEVEVENYEILKEQLAIKLKLSASELETAIPIVTDIRTIRNFTEGTRPQPTYDQLVQLEVKELMPHLVRRIKHGDHYTFKFVNSYLDDRGRKRTFGAKLQVPQKYDAFVADNRLSIKSSKKIKMTIKTITNIRVPKKLRTVVFRTPEALPHKHFSAALLDIYKKAGEDIEHLIKSKKTSSFEYGTIFPRDWIESADLGEGDLGTLTVDYMYSQAMKYISETGEGWHEEIVGAYKLKFKNKKSIVDRIMIDIEPRYIIGVTRLSKRLLLKSENRRKLRLVARYILRNAEEKNLITFKRMHESKEYYHVGNWRDSNNAFPGQKSPLAPYDVNCVFYPTSLKVIKKYHEFFQIKDIDWLNELIDKWDANKQKFRMYHPYDTIGYAIALHGDKNKPLPVAHLDESYDLFYNSPSLEEVVSFAVKLLDPDFFYTPGGPILVANDEDEYSTQQYHGKVIWPKQAAYAIAGLGVQYRKGVTEGWPQNVLDTIKDVIIKTCEACFRGWEQMGVVPELYYYDAKSDKARLYIDQESFEGQMSMVQLWSSVGARRIMREYVYINSV